MVSLPWSSKREKDMFKTIVLALDGSNAAKEAIPVAAELAEKEKAKIVIAHVTEYMAAKGGELPPCRRGSGPRRDRRGGEGGSPIAASRPRSSWRRSLPGARRTRSSRSPTGTMAI